MGCSNLRLAIGVFGVLAWVIGVSGPIPAQAGALEDVQSTLADILSALENLQTDVEGLRSDVDSLTTDVSDLKFNVDQLTTDVSNLQTDVDRPYWNK